MTLNCLKTNPFWMGKIFHRIKDKKITDLIIPGTHNSGSYDRFKPEKETLIRKYSLCQDETVWNQLVYGIRYFDLRVSHLDVNRRNEKLWVVHGPIRMDTTLELVLVSIKNFLEVAPKEVIIIDFHRFEKGFDKGTSKRSIEKVQNRHKDILDLIIKHLGDYILPSDSISQNKKLQEIVESNKRVIITYASDEISNRKLLFPKTIHLWANTDKVDELKKFFSSNLCFRYKWLRSAMAQLTAKDNFSIFFNLYKGLRTMAQQVNYNVTEWFNDSKWWKCANIIATDYFLGNNIIEIAINKNAN